MAYSFVSRFFIASFSLAAVIPIAGCGGGGRNPFLAPENSCGSQGNVFSIDTGSQLTYTPGVDAGYYMTYVGNGEWHLEWACDTDVSSYGCNFTGTIIADTPTQGPNATCVACESNDVLTVGPDSQLGPAGEAQMIIQFNTITTTAYDGTDFFATPGSTVYFDIQVDGEYHPELVFLSSAGALASPLCVPFQLTPTAP